MKKIVCEICGGTDLIKQDGLFVCQECGTKYTVEEAKKMMTDVDSVVQVDKTNEINNRLETAMNEYKVSNYETSAKMCLEILNIDPKNAKAIVFRALSNCWSSTAADNRIKTTSNEICRAIDIIREETESDNDFVDKCLVYLPELSRVTKAIFNLYENYYVEIGEQIKEYQSIARSATRSGVGHAASGIIGGLLTGDVIYAASSAIGGVGINNAGSGSGSEAQRLDNERITTYVFGCVETCEALNNYVMKILDDIKEPTAVSSKSYDELTDLVQYKGYMKFQTVYTAYDEVLQTYDSIIELCSKAKIEIREKENQEYWEEHLDEKLMLEKEKEELLNNLKLLEDEIEKVPEIQDISNIEKSIDTLKKELSSMGLFKNKEKKIIKEKIAALNANLDEAKKTMADTKKTYNDKIDDIKRKLEIIDKKLNREELDSLNIIEN